jgi:hypothetical protein
MTRTRAQQRNFVLYYLVVIWYCVIWIASAVRGSYFGVTVIGFCLIVVLVAPRIWRKRWQRWLGS